MEPFHLCYIWTPTSYCCLFIPYWFTRGVFPLVFEHIKQNNIKVTIILLPSPQIYRLIYMHLESLSLLLPSFKNHAIDIVNVLYAHIKQKLIHSMQKSTKMKVERINMKSHPLETKILKTKWVSFLPYTHTKVLTDILSWWMEIVCKDGFNLYIFFY